MNAPGQRFARWLLLAGWTVLLALLPWWLGLVLLVALTAGAAICTRRSHPWGELCRSGLKWGLPGMLFAVQRALGGDLIAWGAALLGALVGYSLVALLESLLLHRVRRASAPTPEWSELAMAPVGPPARIIELAPVQWHDAADVHVAGHAIHLDIGHPRGPRRGEAGEDLDAGFLGLLAEPAGHVAQADDVVTVVLKTLREHPARRPEG